MTIERLTPAELRAREREIFRMLIEIDTTNAVTPAANAVAALLRTNGFHETDIFVDGPHPDKHNVVVRLRGNGRKKPVLALAHLDVVPASAQQWTVEPFVFLERDDHYYSRGTSDDKAMASALVAALIRLRENNVVLERDIILVLSADEEGGSYNGVKWLLDEHRALVDAEFGINEGGYGRIKDGVRFANQVQASEKTPCYLDVVATGQAGHSSLPPADSAILRLTAAIARISAADFPVELSEITRAFFQRMNISESAFSASSYHRALTRTTCVITRVGAGEANNVVPQSAHALVDCRMLPGTRVENVVARLTTIVNDDAISISPRPGPAPQPASPLTPEIMGAIERVSADLWPGVPVVPVMGVGATDSAHFRRADIPMYGASGLFLDVDDPRAHAPDERVLVQSFHECAEFQYQLLWRLAGSSM